MILSSFLISIFGFRLELVDGFTKIVPSTFGPFIGHHQGLLACIKCVFKEFMKEIFRFLQPYKLRKLKVG